MRKILSISLLTALCFLMFAPAAHAVCPVCTVAVGGILGIGEWLGMDNVLAGIWIGALTLSLVFWTANYMNKKGVKSAWWYLLNIVVYYALTLSAYLLPAVPFGGTGNTLWGMDKLLLGIIVGTIGFWFANKWYYSIKRKNGGRAWFPYQRVVWPIGMLLILTGIFALILYV